MSDIVCKTIGVILTPQTKQDDTPTQPVFAKGVPGRVEVLPEYAEGLRDPAGVPFGPSFTW